MNRDDRVVADFGDEWARFDQAGLPGPERDALASQYFAAFPWDRLPEGAVGADIGCGSGRWAAWLAPRVGLLWCLDPSDRAVEVARRNLAHHPNCKVVRASLDSMPIEPGTLDFAYCLGVLHHVPDTAAGLADCVSLLRPGGVMYVYLYYSLENRPAWFRALWRVSDLGRGLVSRLPRPAKGLACEGIAVLVYWPLARLARLVELAGLSPAHLPLAPYRDKGLYTMRTDARDRFGTRLERRFSRDEVHGLLAQAGLIDIRVPDAFPYWIGCGIVPARTPPA